MLTLITGVPGAGKTLNTIKMVQDEWGDSGRPIYYRGIKNLTLPWIEISDEDCHTWFDYPEGSIFVIDECQQIWPNRQANRQTPDSVSRLDTHRHGGYDFYIITQKPTLVDFGVRAFGGRHFHYERGFNREGTRQLEYQRCVDNPIDYHTRQEAQIKRIKFDKKYYEVYKSAEIHTHKPRIPKKFWYFVAACTFTVCAGAYAFTSIMGRTDPDNQVEVSSFTSNPFDQVRTGQVTIPDGPGDEYLRQWTPRIAGVPHSAPAYDQVTEVKTFPRPQCMRGQQWRTCRCYTQQATPLDIDIKTCNDIVANGWFNPFREEQERGGRRDAPPGSAPNPNHRDSNNTNQAI